MGGSGWREHEPALFVIVSTCPGREIAVPAASARAAQQAARYLLEHYSHIRPTWRVDPDAALGPVVVFGCHRPLTGEHLLDQQAHAFILAAGTHCPRCGLRCAATRSRPRCSRPSTTAWADRARRAASAGPQVMNRLSLPSCPPSPRTRHGVAADDHRRPAIMRRPENSR